MALTLYRCIDLFRPNTSNEEIGKLFAEFHHEQGLMNGPHYHPTIEKDGWRLVSAEERHAANPDTFSIPHRTKRDSLSPGDAAKLLFDIETIEDGKIVDRGVDRMWVIVKSTAAGGYIGILDNDPGSAENLRLRKGNAIFFSPEHVAEIGRPPRSYIIERFGESFFEE